MKKYFLFAYLLVVVLMPGCNKNNEVKNTKIDFRTTFQYYASPIDAEEPTDMLIREGTIAELYGVADTVKGELTEGEIDKISAAMKNITKWDTTYEGSANDRFETLTRMNKSGILTLRKMRDAAAPQPVTDLMQQCNALARRLRAEADKKKKPV